MPFKQLWRKLAPNPLDRLLDTAAKKGKQSFLIVWNRGLGDIPLGLYALVHRIREKIPDAKIAFQTRPDLLEGFALLKDITAFADSSLKRGQAVPLASILKGAFDEVIPKPDPTYWVRWQLGKLTPRLQWKPDWDALCEKYSLPSNCLGVHVQTETAYGYEKNWPEGHWRSLFEKVKKPILLFGARPTCSFSGDHLFDLRGKTGILEMLSIIKNRCQTLVVPDSGVLSLTYFLDVSFPIKVVSLWADPRQGVLKQNVPSPNPLLIHHPILAPEEKLRNISVDEVLRELS